MLFVVVHSPLPPLSSLKEEKEKKKKKKHHQQMEVDQIGTPDPSEIPKITAEVLSPIPETRLEAVRKIRHLLSLEVRPPIQEVIESGILPELVSFLGNDDDSTLQFEAAWSLTNVGSGTSEQTKALVDAKAIPGFVHLLSSRRGELREQAVWALGNIAGDCTEFRDQILEENAMGRLLHCIITSTQLPFGRFRICVEENPLLLFLWFLLLFLFWHCFCRLQTMKCWLMYVGRFLI